MNPAVSKPLRLRRTIKRIGKEHRIEHPTTPLIVPQPHTISDVIGGPNSSDQIETPEKPLNQESRFVIFQAPELPQISIVKPRTPDAAKMPSSSIARTLVDVEIPRVTRVKERKVEDLSIEKDTSPASGIDARPSSELIQSFWKLRSRFPHEQTAYKATAVMSNLLAQKLQTYLLVSSRSLEGILFLKTMEIFLGMKFNSLRS
jgi:hypothetical protein